MPNWAYLLFHFLYTLGLAIWIGGALALGALAAPRLFGSLPREQAGAIFGPILRRFSRVRLGAVIAILIGAGVQFWRWENHAVTIWLGLRWLAIAFLTVTLLYEIVLLEPAMARRDERFPMLHRRAETLMKASLIAALVALFLS